MPPGLAPRDRLDRLLEVLLGAAHITQGCVQRVMTHELSQTMQGHGLSHAVAEAVPKVVWREVSDVGALGVLADGVDQCAFADRTGSCT